MERLVICLTDEEGEAMIMVIPGIATRGGGGYPHHRQFGSPR